MKVITDYYEFNTEFSIETVWNSETNLQVACQHVKVQVASGVPDVGGQ